MSACSRGEDHRFGNAGPRACWLCEGSSTRRLIPTELAAAYRLGRLRAVAELVLAHPEDYPRLAQYIQPGGEFDPYAMMRQAVAPDSL